MNTKTSLPSVVFAQEQDLPWLPLNQTEGFGGLDIPGIDLKYFGKPGRGPWFYLVRHEPGVVVPKHTHAGDVFHYLLGGSWKMGGRTLTEGYMQFEQKGLFYGPIESGPEGSLFLAVYDHEPQFIEPDEH